MTRYRQLPHPKEMREKLRQQGVQKMTDSELLGLLIGDGNNAARQHVLELSGSLLQSFGSLERLQDASLSELIAFSGLGTVKASRLKAALEIGQRSLAKRNEQALSLTGPDCIREIYGPRLSSLKKEVFLAVLIDKHLHWSRDLHLAEGSRFECVLHPRDVFSAIVRESPAGVIFVHNHPSGDPAPSENDRRLTRRLQKAGELLGIWVIDHVIVGNGGYFSFSECGEMGKGDYAARIRRRAVRHVAEPERIADFLNVEEPIISPDLCCIHDFDIF